MHFEPAGVSFLGSHPRVLGQGPMCIFPLRLLVAQGLCSPPFIHSTNPEHCPCAGAGDTVADKTACHCPRADRRETAASTSTAMPLQITYKLRGQCGALHWWALGAGSLTGPGLRTTSTRTRLNDAGGPGLRHGGRGMTRMGLLGPSSPVHPLPTLP